MAEVKETKEAKKASPTPPSNIYAKLEQAR